MLATATPWSDVHSSVPTQMGFLGNSLSDGSHLEPKLCETALLGSLQNSDFFSIGRQLTLLVFRCVYGQKISPAPLAKNDTRVVSTHFWLTLG